MERNNLQPNNTYNASFAPNPAYNANQPQGANPQGGPVPPLANASDLSAHPSARNLQEYNIVRTPQGWIDSWNWPQYQPIQPGEPYMEKLGDEAENTRRMERSLKHAQDCEADGDFQDAEEAYEKVLKYTENAEHYKLYAGCLQKISASLKDETKASVYREKAARAFYYLGDLYQKQGSWNPAQAAYQASCDLALYEAPLKALVDVARHLEETMDLAHALEKLADFYAEKGAIALAIDKLNEAFEVGKVARVLEKLEALYSGEGNPSKIHELAIQRFELQISQDPKNIGLYRKYAWFLKDIGRKSEARAVKERMDKMLQRRLMRMELKFLQMEASCRLDSRRRLRLNEQVGFLPVIEAAALITLLSDSNSDLKSVNLQGCVHSTDAVLDLIVKKFKELEELNLSGCKAITEVGLDAIVEKASELKRLVLDECPATSIKFLHRLNAKGIAFSIKGLSFKKNVLDLSSRKATLSDKELLEALKTNPEITELNLSQCTKITDAGVAPLKNFQWLTWLNLDGCDQLTSDAKEQLKKEIPGLTIT